MNNEDYAKAFYVYKIILDRCAREAGGIIRFFSQHSVLWGVQARKNHKLKENNSAGVCAGLAIEWIKFTLKEKDFFKAMEDVRREVVKEKDGLSPEADAMLSNIDDSHVLQTNVSKAFKDVASFESINEYKYPFNNATKCMKKGHFYYIGTGSTGSKIAGGHAMAAFCHGEKIDFYDPNVGVVTGAKKKIVEKYMKEAVIYTVVDILKKNASECSAKTLKLVEFKPF